MAKRVIGITGGIASGKTVVSDAIKDAGGTIIDADVVSREVTRFPAVLSALKEAFPAAFDGDSLDRVKLRSLAFSTAENTKKLNDVTHPAIIEKLKELIDEASGVAFLVVPLMYESGCDKLCDEVVEVYADEETRIKRLLRRNTDITEEVARMIIARQTNEEERLKKADRVIKNDGGIDDLKRKAIELYKSVARACE